MYRSEEVNARGAVASVFIWILKSSVTETPGPTTDHVDAAPTAWQAFRWLTTTFLSARRRFQIGMVLLLMLLGGVAELFTIGAVFPLLGMLTS